MSDPPTFDVVLYGATGFTGKLTAAYLDGHPELQGRPWAIAGRNPTSLAAVRETLQSEHVETICCPLTDPSGVDAMVGSARTVISTAGPYSAYDGDKLLGACATAGVHYSDLSGEGFWQREMIDRYHQVAQDSGAKIVLGGGVDSIPSDLGMHLALKALDVDPGGSGAVSLTGVYTEYTGSFSGGTLASGKARLAAVESGRLTEAAMRDPYLLAPGTSPQEGEDATPDGMPPGFRGAADARHGWLTPFFMGRVNAPVVRRSLALRGIADRVSYRECCSLAMWLRVGWLYTSRGFGYPLGEPINFRPEPGQGPPSWMIEQGGFTMEVMASTPDGRTAIAEVRGKGDPGYGATSKMLGETALCLAHDGDDHPESAGVLTPSTALGDVLVSRLGSAQGGQFMQLRVP
ncbi:MAG: saccharopine dehydrogenase NADP-binding domain-containing protein [Myxococcota bacterium]